MYSRDEIHDVGRDNIRNVEGDNIHGDSWENNVYIYGRTIIHSGRGAW